MRQTAPCRLARRLLLPMAALLLGACDARWPDHAGVMGAPPPAVATVQEPAPPLAQGLTQSSR